MGSPVQSKSASREDRTLAELIEEAAESQYGWVIVTLSELLLIQESSGVGS
jgi:hypothetical protein